MPRVSILMPTHNREDVVGAAIRSVLDQTETDFELLVVADGCTDGTVAQIAAIGDPRIRLFDLPKAPHFGYANRNVALREACGEYIAYAAHDDLLLPDHLQLLIDRLESTGREWAYSRPLWVSTDGVIVPFATNLALDDELEFFLTTGNTIPASCVVHRRECLDRYGYWPETIASAADWRYWITIIEGGQRQNLTYFPTPTCLHFSADWRRSRHAGVEAVRGWLEIADGGSWWPEALRYAVPTGSPEQQVIAAAMHAGGPGWLERLRAAVGLVLDRVAWDDIRSVRPQLREHALEQQRLRESLGAAEQVIVEGKAALGAMTRALARAESDRQIAAIALSTAKDELRTKEAARCRMETDLHEIRVALSDAETDQQATTVALSRALTEREISDRELRAARDVLSLTLASTSWRVTRPIRLLKHLLMAVRLASPSTSALCSKRDSE